MTARQFVKCAYPKAELVYRYIQRGLLYGKEWYEIHSQGRFIVGDKIIGKGRTSLEAWRDAEKNIKTSQINKS